jgi:GNAT superfamily N-acetyltransferase
MQGTLPETHERLTFREATRADVPEVVRMLADDALGRERERYEEPLPQSYMQAFDAIDSDPNSELIVVEQDGAVIGTLHLTFLRSLSFQGSTRAQIESVRVDQPLRGRGIGRQLFGWAIARARRKQCRLVQLTTNKGRPDAHRFYLRLGFVASHEGMKLDLS